MANNLSRPSSWKHEPLDLRDKRIVITGGTTGIGRATAVLLAAQGARLLLFGRHETELNDALDDVQTLAGDAEVRGLTADSGNLEDVRRVFAAVDEQLGGIDILVNCAALPGKGIADLSLEEIHSLVSANVFGYLACAREAYHRMKASGGGHILCVGSMSPEEGDPGADVYTATKGAIRSFCYSLRQSVNEHGIHVTCIEPGAVGTDMPGTSPAEQRESQAKDEVLTAEDIAESIAFSLTQPNRCDVVFIQVRPHRQMI